MSKQGKYHNLGTVIRFELLRTIKKPSFWLATLTFPLIFVAIFGVMYLSNKASDAATERRDQEELQIAYSDESGIIAPEIAQGFGAKLTDDKEQAISDAKNHKIDVYIAYPKNPHEEKTEIHAKDSGLFNNGKYDTVAKTMMEISARAQAGGEEIVKLAQGRISTDLTAYEEDGEVSPGIMKAIAPGIYLVIFYFIIALLGGALLNSTIEEKENRVTEMILTSIHPDNLIIGKIIAMLIAGLIQAVTILALPLILYFAMGSGAFAQTVGISEGAQTMISEMISEIVIDPQLMFFGALILIGSIILYAGLMVAIGAIMPTAKEASSWISVIVLMMLIPIYFATILISDPQSLVSQIATFFPLTAPISALLRNAAGSLTVLESVIISAELIILGILTIKFAVYLFRKGAMEYSAPLSIKRIFGKS